MVEGEELELVWGMGLEDGKGEGNRWFQRGGGGELLWLSHSLRLSRLAKKVGKDAEGLGFIKEEKWVLARAVDFKSTGPENCS